MNILVTGAKGMVGTALVNNLKNIKENKNRTRPSIHVTGSCGRRTYRTSGICRCRDGYFPTRDMRI